MKSDISMKSPRGLSEVERRLITDEEWAAAQLLTSRLTSLATTLGTSLGMPRPTSLSQMPAMTNEQIKEIRNWVLHARHRQNAHPWRHNAISVAILSGLFTADVFGVLYMPRLLHLILSSVGLSGVSGHSLSIYSGLLMAFLHGLIAYSINVYSLHEGAAHDSIILGTGPVSKFLRGIANNACRLFFADPVFYHGNHLLHHQKFATRNDGAFSNFVSSRRILISLLPFVHLLGLSNYHIHRGEHVNKSSLFSLLLSAVYSGGLTVLAVQTDGWLYAVLAVLVVGPWIGFSLDRLRETSEHILMPLNYYNGARNLGTGVWAMVIGGGPWGQPCHLSHHLGADLAWYNQIGLHGKMMEIFSPEQREFFTIEGGLLGYPRFVIAKWRTLLAIESEVAGRSSAAQDSTES